jgi:type IV/VI secretion system ImpK/VasF family protein
MTPEFAAIVDPLLISLMDCGGSVRNKNPRDLREELTGKIDRAEARLKTSEEWQSAKYAIVCWVDSQIIDENPEWEEQPLEKGYFRTTKAHTDFFERAEEAYRKRYWDALEVYFLCFIFGFRGVYKDNDRKIMSRDLPSTDVEWQKKTAQRIADGRPRQGGKWGALMPHDPDQSSLTGRPSLIRMILLFVVCAAFAVVAYCWFRGGFTRS